MIYHDKIYIPYYCEKLVWGNTDTVDALFKIYVYQDEICQDALCSYYVDYYNEKINHDGLLQFILENQNNKKLLQYIHQGLTLMRAKGNLELFDRAIQCFKQLDPIHQSQFLAGEYFAKDCSQRNFLNQFDDLFLELAENENLFWMNHEWLSCHPKLERIHDDDFTQVLSGVQKQISNWEQRKQVFYENRPRHIQLIELLCNQAGLVLESIHGNDPMFEYQEDIYMAWYFNTHKGLFYMIDFDDKAILFDAETQTKVLEVVT